jgi:hypothetical protein
MIWKQVEQEELGQWIILCSVEGHTKELACQIHPVESTFWYLLWKRALVWLLFEGLSLVECSLRHLLGLSLLGLYSVTSKLLLGSVP